MLDSTVDADPPAGGSPDSMTPVEPLGSVRLDAYARELASQLQVSEYIGYDKASFRQSYARDIDIIERAYAASTKWLETNEPLSPVAEWLLDNFYVIREQIRDVRDHLPPSYSRELPKLADRQTRVHVVARSLISHCDAALDEELIIRFIDQFQTNVDLTIGETWAFPTMLQLSLIEELTGICAQMLQDYQSIGDANDILAGWEQTGRFQLGTNSSLRSAPTLIALYDLLRDRGGVYADAVAKLDRQVHTLGWHLTDLRRLERHRLAANQVSIGNIITSMRLLKSLDWISFFEQTNRSERILQQDPQQIYQQMDFPSRNRYRDAIEELSKCSQSSETEVARQALLLARNNSEQRGLDIADGERLNGTASDSIDSHIGFWLVDDGRQALEDSIHYRPSFREAVRRMIRRQPHLSYFGALSAITAGLLAAFAWHCVFLNVAWPVIVFGSLLLLIPFTEVAQQIINAVLTRILRVNLLPKLEFSDGVPERFPTFVVVPSLLSNKREVLSLLTRLECHYLANQESSFSFALLTDFKDASQQVLPEDDEILRVATEAIRALNKKYGIESREPFYLLHRERRWNDAESKWMGWERKRGKLMEFGELLAGSDQTSFTVRVGNERQLAVFRDPQNRPMIITLDADTILPRDSARALVGTLAHPLNRPIIATENNSKIVKRGYSILQPCISIHLDDVSKSRYLSVQAVNPGIDPYATAASDVYQDLFGEGSFTGKGIYDLHAFECTLKDVFPENHVLSHDLIEGCHARVGLVSDIEFFDGYPFRYDVDAKRSHRWVRGDWQILPWLCRRVPSCLGLKANPLSMLARWKIIDNMRRSLIAPAVLAFLLGGWVVSPAHAWQWTMTAALILFFPVFVQVVTQLLAWTTKFGFTEQFRLLVRNTVNTLEQCFYAASFLPHKTWQMLDAIARTLYRLVISRKNLLEWETAAAAESRLSRSHWAIVNELGVCSLLAILVFIFVDRSARTGALPWLGIWLVAPLVGELISAPRRNRAGALEPSDSDWLTLIASGTWGFFEQYVNAKGNWLPPDNVQEYPEDKVAYRISPTNEGLFLVSGLVANRFGFIGVHALLTLWNKNLASWNSLPQMHGHHYNWYETRELRALHPRYVSTVDSGNLMACYLTLCHGVEDLITHPILSSNHIHGARTSLCWLNQEQQSELRRIKETSRSVDDQINSLQSLAELIAELEQSLTLDADSPNQYSPDQYVQFADTLRMAAGRLIDWSDTASGRLLDKSGQIHHQARIVADRFRSVVADFDRYLSWLPELIDFELNVNEANQSKISELLPASISLRELAQLTEMLTIDRAGSLDLPDSLKEIIHASAAAAATTVTDFATVCRQCETASSGMQFDFLYNARRKLFSIGFNADTGQRDRGHYDLLGSEARIASYLAVAKGDVDSEHWFRLGRQATSIHGGYTLLSWGGSMFEYLMPQLFQRSYENSLLDTSCQTAITRQIEYGRQRHIPWGISESAYAAMASNTDYQYKSFGVPGLGLKRGLSKDLVVSPYSSAIALPFRPEAATKNLKDLAPIGLGRWGFYDALDFTPSRLQRKKQVNIVRNYMAHHQGMTLLALANVLQQQIVIRWFHAHPMVRANELLLQEKVPTLAGTEVPNPDEIEVKNVEREQTTLISRQISGVHSSSPRILLLSNGKFSSLLTHTGGSYARNNDIQVTRWRADPTQDNWGTFVYLKDCDSGFIWSAAYQPTRIDPDHYEAIFSVDKGEIHRRQGDIETVLELVVSPDHDAEARQLRITNHAAMTRKIQVTSYAEVALATQSADVAHPAFQKLFVETEFVSQYATLVARRRPRESQQPPLYALHTLAVPPAFADSVTFDSSRETFLGRRGTPEHPAAMAADLLSQSSGAVLDPVFSLRCVVTIEPGESVLLGLMTGVADNRDQALALADLFHDLRGVQRSFELAWAFAQIELRHLNISARDVHLFQQLGGVLLYPNTGSRGDANRIAANRLGQKSLWHFGISGDVPILLLRVTEVHAIDLVKQVVLAHDFLISRGLVHDLVVVNDFPGAYFDALQDQLQMLINERSQNADMDSKRVFLLRGAQLTFEDHQLLDACAMVSLHGTRGTLAQQLDTARVKDRSTSVAEPPRIVHPSKRPSTTYRAKDSEPDNRFEFFNGWGGFVDQGRRYEMLLDPGAPTPAPWSNVIANPQFGALVTESGGGYTWFANSRENKLTSWSNDPVSDPPAEIVYVCDADYGHLWSPTAPLGSQSDRRVVHGQGYSVFNAEHAGIQAETLITVHQTEPLKLVRVRLHNASGRQRRLRLSYFADTVLGVSRESTVLHQVSRFDTQHAALLMHNGFHPEFPSQEVFLALIGATDVTWTADRRGFIGRDGSLAEPIGLRRQLSQTGGAGLDPCMVLQGSVTIEPDATEEVFFLLGAGHDPTKAMELLDRNHEPAQARDAIRDSIEFWNESLTSISVETPNRAMDLMVNRWLPYQVLSCRLWGRSAFYQSGGAYGFRDQLQDVMALVYSHPELARQQILRAAARQYLEGDVQHWWHPPSGKGTRTRFSDDFLFLPFVTMHYLRCTGDLEILDQDVPFLESAHLTEHEQERYEQPTVSQQSASLLEHCQRAIAHGFNDGQHDLPLMGCGDWNDGMNKVGEAGRGESVWVAWFQIVILEEFSALLQRLGSAAIAGEYQDRAAALRSAVEQHAWDGQWYRRAFTDEGTPLGSRVNSECQIDSLTQSWSVLAGAPAARAQQAYSSAQQQLVRDDDGMILLFTPPFDDGALDPGYIKGYVPGVRENGGQYSHAAMWMIQAAARLGDGDLAMRLFDLINPIMHSDSRSKAQRYRVDPYVIAADVYSNEQHLGRGGWTWYTGSASWMYRVAIEDILGIRIEGTRLRVQPNVPSQWSEFKFTYRRNATIWHFKVVRSAADPPAFPAELELTEDGKEHTIDLSF